MPEQFRGGNSRSLAKALDAIRNPLAVLDRKGQVVFVNGALCELVRTDQTAIVGQQCRWDLPEDSNPIGDLLYTLAPPLAVRQGKIEVRPVQQRQLDEAGFGNQTFLPILDEHQILDLTLVVFSNSHGRSNSVGSNSVPKQISPDATAQLLDTAQLLEIERRAEHMLVKLRTRWQVLDNMQAVIGCSSEIQLAMQRSQAAIATHANVLIHGPVGSGKLNLARGIFDARVSKAQINPLTAQFFVLDCSVLDADLIDGLLEVLAGRIKPLQPIQSHHLVLNELQSLSEVAIMRLLHWLEHNEQNCLTMGTSQMTPAELSTRGGLWETLVCKLMSVDISIPPLGSRAEDIPALAHEIIATECRRVERALLTLSSETLDLLVAYPWPRNRAQLVETLTFAIENAVLTTAILPEHLPVELRTFAGEVDSGQKDFGPIELDQLLEDVERATIKNALQHSPRNRAEVARLLGISRARLLRRIEQLGLDQEEE